MASAHVAPLKWEPPPADQQNSSSDRSDAHVNRNDNNWATTRSWSLRHGPMENGIMATKEAHLPDQAVPNGSSSTYLDHSTHYGPTAPTRTTDRDHRRHITQNHQHHSHGGLSEFELVPALPAQDGHFAGDVKSRRELGSMNTAVAYSQANGLPGRQRSTTASAYSHPGYTPDIAHLREQTSPVTRFLLTRVQQWPLLHSILAEKDSRRIFYFMT